MSIHDVRIRAGLVALAVGLLAGCSGDGGEPSSVGGEGETTSDSAPTYYKDVYPIVRRKCTGCHAAGGLAAFALEDPAVVASMAPLIHQVTESGEMPPWPPTDLSPALRDARTLAPEELATLAEWSSTGAKLGEPGEQPEGVEPEVFPFKDPSLVVDMGVDYSPDPEISDDYRCFAVDLGLSEARKLVGFRVLPGNGKIVHHVVTSLYKDTDLPALRALDAETAAPGWPCFGGPVPEGRGITPIGSLGSWTPGNVGRVMYPGTALEVAAHSVVVMGMHYNTANGREPDRTAMELHFAPPDEAESLLPVRGFGVATRNIRIPANSESAVITATRALPARVEGEAYLVGASAHGHYLLKKHRITLNKGLSGETTLLDLDWDFHWQGEYLYEEPIPIKAGDTITVDCTYDNSPAYRMSVGLPAASQEVTWGEGTTDEMCMANVQLIGQLPDLGE